MANAGVKPDAKRTLQESIEDRRQGKRLNLRFEIEISGKDVRGSDYHLETFTRDISQNGCCFAIPRELAVGEMVNLSVIHRNGTGAIEVKHPLRFHVAWVNQEDNTWLVGAEMLDPAKPWGVTFPPKSSQTRPS